MRNFTPDPVTELKENEVFVFGSNASGFHGAGAAGWACRKDNKNNWREDKWFVDALKTPLNHPDRIGAWAVLGIGRGFQKGYFGSSYAIETIKRPGQKRSTPLSEILIQIQELSSFAKKNNDLIFLVTKIGSVLAGYTQEEISNQFKQVIDLPDNVILPKEYEFRE